MSREPEDPGGAEAAKKLAAHPEMGAPRVRESLYATREKAFRMRISSIQQSHGEQKPTDRAMELAKDYSKLSKRGQLHFFLFVSELMFALADATEEEPE